LIASDRTGIPQVYRFGYNGHIRRRKLPVHSISSDRDDDRADQAAKDYSGYERPFSPARAIFLPEDKQPAHARGTVRRVRDSRVRQRDPLRFSSQIPEEGFIRARTDRSRFAGKHSLLVALRKP
jgi:hypothetical protein